MPIRVTTAHTLVRFGVGMLPYHGWTGLVTGLAYTCGEQTRWKHSLSQSGGLVLAL